MANLRNNPVLASTDFRKISLPKLSPESDKTKGATFRKANKLNAIDLKYPSKIKPATDNNTDP